MKSFQAGLSSWAFPWALGVGGYPPPALPLTPADLVDKASDLGAQVLQIADNMPLSRLTHRELDALGQRARDKGITLEGGTRGLNPENLLNYLELALRLNMHLIRTLPHDGEDRPDFKEAEGRLAAVLPLYEKAGVVLALENHDFYPAAWIGDLVECFKGSVLGVCLDPVNNLGQGESEQEVLCRLAPLTVNFHCKDYTIRRKPSTLGFDIEGVPLGQGMLDLDRAQRLLPEGLSWIIELWTPWQGNSASTLSLESRWAGESVKTLLKHASLSTP